MRSCEYGAVKIRCRSAYGARKHQQLQGYHHAMHSTIVSGPTEGTGSEKARAPPPARPCRRETYFSMNRVPLRSLPSKVPQVSIPRSLLACARAKNSVIIFGESVTVRSVDGPADCAGPAPLLTAPSLPPSSAGYM